MKNKPVSFYKFAITVQKIVGDNNRFGERVYFQSIFPKIEECLKISLDQFRIFALDLSLIFPTKVRLNPKIPGKASLYLVYAGGTTYDSFLIKEKLLK